MIQICIRIRRFYFFQTPFYKTVTELKIICLKLCAFILREINYYLYFMSLFLKIKVFTSKLFATSSLHIINTPGIQYFQVYS